MTIHLQFAVQVEAQSLTIANIKFVDDLITQVGEVTSRSDLLNGPIITWHCRIKAEDLWDAALTYHELRSQLESEFFGVLTMPERPRIFEGEA